MILLELCALVGQIKNLILSYFVKLWKATLNFLHAATFKPALQHTTPWEKNNSREFRGFHSHVVKESVLVTSKMTGLLTLIHAYSLKKFPAFYETRNFVTMLKNLLIYPTVQLVK